ncbi:MAG TPA: sugar kinase [Tessaracoccus flavescens]|uniref:Sugar kinase n=1 Tax=Tessaracoccus flavescens TaxID=399497 RepID=A0A921EMX4_9ACTN|nr:sugar kinase [Tessaracoccus flavescens]
MSLLDLRSADDTTYDVVSLGEVMLRLDPGEGRIRTARTFNAWEGGGEYNVARGLARVFGQRVAIVTSLVDNEVGRLVESLMLAGGVDVSHTHWVADDGCGRTARNGLNFTERGFGLRKAKGVSDRGHTAIAQLAPGDVDFDHLFGEVGVRWFHTGGIYAALSEQAAATALAAVQAAKRHRVVVSYDLNYRPSLWKAIGGQARAQEVNRELARFVDVMLGNEEDFSAGLGFEVEGVGENLNTLPVDAFTAMIEKVADEFDNFKVITTTLRSVTSASLNDWSALGWSRADGVLQAADRRDIEIMDRVGGGDSFASGVIYGLMNGESLQTSLEYGAAHGALAMTTPGDTSMASLDDVLHVARGGSARVER